MQPASLLLLLAIACVHLHHSPLFVTLFKDVILLLLLTRVYYVNISKVERHVATLTAQSREGAAVCTLSGDAQV